MKTIYKHIEEQTNEIIIQEKTCRISWRNFALFQSDQDFLKRIFSSLPWFKEERIQFPTLDFRERQRRRLLQRNERNYYKSECAMTWKSVISNYNHDLWWTVYSRQVRWSDAWDAKDYWQERDKERWFFEQFHDLKRAVPKIALMNDNWLTSVNCDYTYDILQCKDCYMTVEAIDDEVAHYCMCVHRSKNMIDCSMVYDSEYCITCTDSNKLYKCFYTQNSDWCSNMYFAWDCKWCSDCFFSVWLRNKKYCILNKQYTKEEYEEKKKALVDNFKNNSKELLGKRRKFLEQQPRLYANIVNSENSIWHNIISSSNILIGFEMFECKDCSYCFNVLNSTDSKDIDVSTHLNRCYESVTPDMSKNTAFAIFCSECVDVWYSEMCHRSKNCFWCVWLKDQQYCILNKQYTKEEYEALLPEIIESMRERNERGEFFPASISAFPYNRSDAMQQFPLTREEAIEKWYSRDDKEITVNIPVHAECIHTKEMDWDPDTVSNEIIKKVLVCSETWKPFRIVFSELELYRKLWCWLPLTHHDVRYYERMATRAERNVYAYECAVTWDILFTPYSKNLWLRVLSEEAYAQIVW